MEILTEVSLGNKVYTNSIELIPNIDVLLASQGDRNAMKRIQEIEDRNNKRKLIKKYGKEERKTI